MVVEAVAVGLLLGALVATEQVSTVPVGRPVAGAQFQIRDRDIEGDGAFKHNSLSFWATIFVPIWLGDLRFGWLYTITWFAGGATISGGSMCDQPKPMDLTDDGVAGLFDDLCDGGGGMAFRPHLIENIDFFFCPHRSLPSVFT